MIHQIAIYSTTFDPRADTVRHQIQSGGFKQRIKNVQIVDIYTIEKSLSPKQLETIAPLFINPVTQTFSINTTCAPKDFSYGLEIGFLPGVTDNIASTVKQTIEDGLKTKFASGEGVYSSQLFLIDGEFGKNELVSLGELFINPLIQRVSIKNKKQFTETNQNPYVPSVKLRPTIITNIVNLDVDDRELVDIGKLGIKNNNGSRRGPLALDLLSMKTIQSYFKKKRRKPSDIELEALAQTWSEHCKHTIFRNPLDNIQVGLFKRYIKKATDEIRKKKGKKDFCFSVFTDNSGAIIFDKDYVITHKVETHNSPSALDPYGGALTGIVGVNRDAIGFGLGAKPIANTYGFCFADPGDNEVLYRDRDKKQKMLSPKRMLEGVVAGVNSGGNCSGIPTPNGFIYFDERFKGKPLVFVGTVGLIPKKVGRKRSFAKKANPGDYIVMIGGRVGIDGIHGATFSSVSLDSKSPATAVQIGDPITQKKFSDAICKEARGLGLFTSITDNGAGGLSSSVAEMAKESGGCKVELDKVPLKYPGLAPWQIWISESQERMTLAVSKNKWKKFSNLMERRGVESTIIGTFTNSGKCVVYYNKEKVMDIEMKFLHDGLPLRNQQSELVKPVSVEDASPHGKDFTSILLALIRLPTNSSYAFISQQFDHEVQSTSVTKPLQGRGRINSDGAVIKPVYSSKKGIALSYGLYPRYSDIDTYRMAACSIDTAIRNCICCGAGLDKIAILDNFCWCSSENPIRLGQLKRALEACYDMATAYGTPFISGKDSMFNDFHGYDEKGKSASISIPPTLLISSLGIIDNVENAATLDAKFPDDLLYVLGETHDELGGSEYYEALSIMYKKKWIGTNVPNVHTRKNKKIYTVLSSLIQKNLAASVQSIHRGGIVYALAKICMGGLLGADVSLKQIPGTYTKNESALFSESQGRILISINPRNKKKVEAMLAKIPYVYIGKIHKSSAFKIKGNDNTMLVETTIDTLLKEYRTEFASY